jgi:hypothetical protein
MLIDPVYYEDDDQPPDEPDIVLEAMWVLQGSGCVECRRDVPFGMYYLADDEQSLICHVCDHGPVEVFLGDDYQGNA